MNKNKIKQLSNFFYSSNEADEVPLRISAITGAYTGFDLSKEAFEELLELLNNSVNLKEDLRNFRQKYE